MNNMHFYSPAIFNGGGHIASPLSGRTVLPVCTSRTKTGFWAIAFEYNLIWCIGFIFIHRYIITKYRSCSIMDKIHLLLSELWPLISVRKMVSGEYLLYTLVNWIQISYTDI